MQELGPGVRGLKPGDHFVASFLPACGKCRWCATGHQDVGVSLLLGTFAEYGVVSGASLVKIAVDIVADKRDKVTQFGATYFATSMAEAMPLVADLTRGVMAERWC